MRNRLEHETSPYLRQHRDNPVHWQPWDDQALTQASTLDRPILLSIGYSACHWCHVMAHECFENEAIAQVMNQHFVNIKVDREQRPDLDRIYQLAHQALTGRGGGWPLTVFLTPGDRLPFFAGTYFPPQPRHGLPAFPDLLEGLARLYRERRDELHAQNRRMQDFLDEMAAPTPAAAQVDPERSYWRDGLNALARAADPVHGGHRGAPKFPHPAELRLWLRALGNDGAGHPDAEHIVQRGLNGMARRGLHDHLGGGFFRYCVDEAWTIPHFEKMLYDNAQLLPIYAEAALAFSEQPGSTGDVGGWLAVAAATVAFLDRDLCERGGAFQCALDADSEGGEGAYYVWTPDQVRAELSPHDAERFLRRHGLDGDANFEGHAWHLLLADDASLDCREPAAAASVATLLAARRQRPAPGLDDKVLTGWNALTIAGLCRCARAVETLAESSEPVPGWAGQRLRQLVVDCDRLAVGALDALHRDVWHEGALYADRERRFPAWLDDHAYLLDALIERLQRQWHSRDAGWAVALADALLARFEDAEHGGFWFTAHDHEPLPQRPRPWTDDATPSGHAVAIRALSVLGALFAQPHWSRAAERGLRASMPILQQQPQACASLLLALDEQLAPPPQCVLRLNDPSDLDVWRPALALLRRGRSDTFPNPSGTRIFLVPAGLASPLPAMLAIQPPGTEAGTGAWLCRTGTCTPRLATPTDLLDAISAV